ncbi:50S ribosomal protein L3, putative [Theileria equi strain WA]|uniref:Large ribosomal subunit protein uL3m n=1 Tax=Theileria equi strain WA TaxID=1537102 RepID=L0B173_THEEQ|nr:50S ribosomal protein L3, putative [Theileria equi strain WA]AFZ81575.1 50S ribosomal protein L3, putative [Theileria equi strain WA]|eukprot:XP_004831241.1 50S ribosomal protein L3, putative [Theileria equi strain WA]
MLGVFNLTKIRSNSTYPILLRRFTTASQRILWKPYTSRWIKRIQRLNDKKNLRKVQRVSYVPETERFSEEDIRQIGIKPIKPIWNTIRAGVLAYKVGCMSLWDDWGERHAVTVCHVDRCVVIERKTIPKHGYEALQLGLGYKNVNTQTKPNIGRFIKLGIGSKDHIAEFKCSSDCLLPEGHYMSVRHFTPGQWVFVSGWSKQKGFKGAMRRWHFGGQSKSHGTECKAHSAPGSISQGKSVHIVWRNTKMGGHVGPDPRCMNCRVFRIESHRNLIFLKGTVPGNIGGVIKIKDAVGITARKNKGLHIHYPTFLPKSNHPYPVTLQEPTKERDPFLCQEEPMYEHKSRK